MALAIATAWSRKTGIRGTTSSSPIIADTVVPGWQQPAELPLRQLDERGTDRLMDLLKIVERE
jgi:hypothetical protein